MRLCFSISSASHQFINSPFILDPPCRIIGTPQHYTQFDPSTMASELMIGTWTSRSVAMVAAGLRLTGTKAKKLAITTSNKQQLVLTDGTVLKQTKAMVMKLVEIAGSPFTKTLLGADALERAKVSQWMEYTTSNCRNKDAAEDSVQNLDAHFKASTFVALERMTLADLKKLNSKWKRDYYGLVIKEDNKINAYMQDI